MTLKQQPTIRVIDPESEYFEENFNVQEIEHGPERVWVGYPSVHLGFDQIQELTPLSHDGVRIGVGDEVVVAESFCFTVAGYYQADGEDIVVLEKYGATHASKISDHTPLTEMNKENEAVDKITDDFEKDWCGCEIRDSGAFICDEHLPVYSILSSGDDKPTIERIDLPDHQKERIKQALADAGLIRLEDNQDQS